MTPSERQKFDDKTGVRMMRRAAQLFYDTDKYGRRGEFGELLLQPVVSEVFGTEPAISKLFIKDAANDTVNGFDCVHAVAAPDDLELWLGEVKWGNLRVRAGAAPSAEPRVVTRLLLSLSNGRPP